MRRAPWNLNPPLPSRLNIEIYPEHLKQRADIMGQRGIPRIRRRQFDNILKLRLKYSVYQNVWQPNVLPFAHQANLFPLWANMWQQCNHNYVTTLIFLVVCRKTAGPATYWSRFPALTVGRGNRWRCWRLLFGSWRISSNNMYHSCIYHR
jgi:hypothetical protein